MGARVSSVSSNTVEVQEVILYNDINKHKRNILESKETKMVIVMITRLQNEKKRQPDKGVS